MDPDVCLSELRELVATIRDFVEEEVEEAEAQDCAPGQTNDLLAQLVEHVEALDSWLKNGGFLPKDWAPKPLR